MLRLLACSHICYAGTVLTHVRFVFWTGNWRPTLFKTWNACTFARAELVILRASNDLGTIVYRFPARIVGGAFHWSIWWAIWDRWAILKRGAARTITVTVVRVGIWVRACRKDHPLALLSGLWGWTSFWEYWVCTRFIPALYVPNRAWSSWRTQWEGRGACD